MVIDCIKFYEIVRSQRLDAALCLQATEEQKASKYYLEILMFPRSSQSSRAARTRNTCFPFEPFHPSIKDTAYAESVNTEAQHPSNRSCVPLISSLLFQHLLPPLCCGTKSLLMLFTTFRGERRVVLRDSSAKNNNSAIVCSRLCCSKPA